MKINRNEALRTFHEKPSDEQKLACWRNEFEWAIQIIERRFREGIDSQFSEKRLQRTWRQFDRTKDPIYHELLEGMGDKALAATFVSYWKSGQALATRSRFWLEHALVEILVYQALHHHDCNVQVYTNAMLRSGMLLENKPVHELGIQGVFEHQAPQGVWEVQIKTALLDKIDQLVAQQERVPLLPNDPTKRLKAVDEATRRLLEADREAIRELRETPADDRLGTVPLRCNLIIVDPNKVQGVEMINALRIINPRTLDNPAQRKQERINILRLYAYLIQEKADFPSNAIRVRVAELLPRYSHFDQLDHYPQYFSDLTYWTAIETWGFIGVPISAIRDAIRSAASSLRGSLIKQLRAVLPQ